VAVSESSRLSEEDTGQALGEVVDREKFKDLDGYSKRVRLARHANEKHEVELFRLC
jgi:hypothetical protein